MKAVGTLLAVCVGICCIRGAAWAQTMQPPPGTGMNTFLPGEPTHGGQGFPTTKTVTIGGASERITYQLSRGLGGYMRGVDVASGRTWHVDIRPNGSMKGKDLDGATWTYSAATHTYSSATAGRTCDKTSILHVCAP